MGQSIKQLWRKDPECALGGKFMKVAEVFAVTKAGATFIQNSKFKIFKDVPRKNMKKKGIWRDSTDFICISTSSQGVRR